MAKVGRKKKKKESISGYFRRVFREQPDLLNAPSNDVLLEMWLKDHPSHSKVPPRVRQNLANVKSLLRKKEREGPAGKPVLTTVVVTAPVEAAANGMEQLEEYIDDCLTTARNLDREGLESVIRLLRRARNEVVWKLGQ